MVTKLTEFLPASLKRKIGEIEVLGSKAHKIKVHVVPPAAQEVAIIFKETLAETIDPDLKFNDRILYATAEREPEEQKLFASAGRVRAFLNVKAMQ